MASDRSPPSRLISRVLRGCSSTVDYREIQAQGTDGYVKDHEGPGSAGAIQPGRHGFLHPPAPGNRLAQSGIAYTTVACEDLFCLRRSEADSLAIRARISGSRISSPLSLPGRRCLSW